MKYFPTTHFGANVPSHRTIEKAIEEAARDLPEGWTIVLSVENGAAWVEAVRPNGIRVTIDDPDGDIYDRVREAGRLAVDETKADEMSTDAPPEPVEKAPQTPPEEAADVGARLPVWDYAATGRTRHVFYSTGDVRTDNQTLCGRAIQRAIYLRRLTKPVVCPACLAKSKEL